MKLSVPDTRTAISTVLICAVVLCYASALAAELFAPKISLPDKMESRDYSVKLVESWNVPSKEEVGFPAYAGSFIIAMMEAGPMVANDDTVMALPSMTLATEDELAKVVSFYKEKLQDWKYKNSYDMFDIFWIGPDDFNNFDMTVGMTIPNVVIFEANSGQTDFMPKAKTTITIVYKPKK